MRIISVTTYKHLLKSTPTPKRVQRELTFRPENYNWEASDFITVTNKTKAEGLFVFGVSDEPTGFYFKLRDVASDAAGRRKPYICDFCFTWLQPSRSSTVTFILSAGESRSVSYRCCHNLECNLNMRSFTEDTMHSRVQLREDLSNEERISRFQNKLQAVARHLAS